MITADAVRLPTPGRMFVSGFSAITDVERFSRVVSGSCAGMMALPCRRQQARDRVTGVQCFDI